MARPIWLAVGMAVSVTLGCTGGGATPDAGSVDAAIADGAVGMDATGPCCNPITQGGCQPGEKCTWIIQVAGPPQLAYTGCTPDGDQETGDACTLPEVGADDCVAGSYCLDGVCHQICAFAPDSCPDTSVCGLLDGVLDDNENVGLCRSKCDPVVQDCTGASDACYLRGATGASYCLAVPPSAATQTQDMVCYGPATGGCYHNGCAEGYGPNQPDDTCAFFCNPIDNWVGNVNGLAGDPAGISCAATFAGARPDGPGSPYECRYIQSYYSNTDAVAAAIGMCLDPNGGNGGGSCADFDLTQLISDMNDGTADAADYCDSICPECCMLDCISLATADAMLPALRARYDCYVSRPEVRARCGLGTPGR